MTASTTTPPSEENVPKALENPLEPTDTTSTAQAQTSERLLDATRTPATTTPEKPLADKITDAINNVESNPNVQSGLTTEQRTALEIQRVIREELAKKPANERAALAQQLTKAFPKGWKVNVITDAKGEPVFQIGKVSGPTGVIREVARVQSKDVAVAGTNETDAQKGARLAERLKGFAGNDKFTEAWMKAITGVANEYPPNLRGPNDPFAQFLKGFNDRLKDEGVTGFDLALKSDGKGLVLTRPEGKQPIGVDFGTPSDNATLARFVRETQVTPADLLKTLNMEGVTPLDIARKFGDVLRAEGARNPADPNRRPEEHPEILRSKLQTALAGSGYEAKFDPTTKMFTLVKSDGSVVGRVDYNNVKFEGRTPPSPERTAGLLLEPLAAMNDVQRTNYLSRASAWFNQPGRTDAEQTAFRTALQTGLLKYPELQYLKINGEPLALDFSENKKLRASLEKYKSIDILGPADVPIAAPTVNPEIAKTVETITFVEGILKAKVAANPDKPEQAEAEANRDIAAAGGNVFLKYDAATQQMVLRNGPNANDKVMARYAMENLKATTEPAQLLKNFAASLTRPLIGMNEEQQKAYFAMMVQKLAQSPNETGRRILMGAVNDQLAKPNQPETKGLTVAEAGGNLSLLKEGRKLVELPIKANPADTPAPRPPVNLDAILGADKAKLTTPELEAAALKFFDAATPANEKLKMAEILAAGGIKSLTVKDGEKSRTLTFEKSGPYMHVYANDNSGRNTIYLRGTKRGDDYVQQTDKKGRQVGFYGTNWTKSVGKDSILGSNVATAADRPADAPRSEVNAVTDANRMLGLTPIVGNDSAAFQTRMDQRIRFSDPTDLTPKSVIGDFNAYLKASLGNPPQLDEAKATKLAEAYSAALRAEALLNPPPKLSTDAAQNKALMDKYAKKLADDFNAGISPEFKQLLQVAPSKNKQGIDTVALQFGQSGSFQDLFGEPRELLGQPLVQFADMMKRSKTDGERAQIFSDFVRRETIQNPTASAAELAKRFDDVIQAAKIPDLKVEIARTGSSDAQLVLRRPNSAEPIVRIDPKNVARKDASGVVKENYQQLAGRLIEPLAALKGDEISAHMQRLGASMKDMPVEQRAKLLEAIKAEISKRPELSHLSLAEKPDQKGAILSSTRTGDKPVDIVYGSQVSDRGAPVAATTSDGNVDLKAIVGEAKLATLKAEQIAALKQLLKPGATQTEQLQAIEALANSKLRTLKIKDGDKDRTLSFAVQSAGKGKSYIGLFATDDKGKSRIAIRGMNDGKGNYVQQGKASVYGNIWSRDIGNKSILTGGKANPAATQPGADQTVTVPPLFDAKKIDWNATNNVVTPEVVSPGQPRVEVPKVLESGTPLNSDAVVKSLVDTGLTGKSNLIFNSADHARVRAMLKDYSPDQLKEIKAKFQQVTGTGFDEALAQKFSGSELNELRFLGEGLNDRTTRIMKALQERSQLFGRSNTVIEKDLRDTLATMNKAEIDALDAKFKERNGGKSLLEAIQQSSLSSTTRQALQVYMKGSDQLKNTDYRTLIALAKGAGTSFEPISSVDMFKEATRFMKADIRAELKDELVAAAHSWNFSINPFSYTSTELEDYARYGGLSSATEVSRQTSGIGDWFTNKEGIRNALAAMSQNERNDFVNGKLLTEKQAASKTPLTLSADEQRQLKYYQDLKAQIDRSPEHAKINYMDIALYGGEGSIVSKIAAPDSWFNRSANEFLDIIDKQWTEQDWERATNPKTKDAFKAEFERAVRANAWFSSDVDRAMAVFNAKANAQSGAESKGVTRDIVSALKDKVGIFSSDQAGMLDVIFNMTDAQKKRLATDPEYKKQVIAEIYGQHAGTLSINGVGLGNVWSGISEFQLNPFTSGFFKSYVPFSSLLNTENWLGAGRINFQQRELALRAIERFSKDPPEKVDLLDKLAYHQAKGSSAAEITADIQKAIKDDPSLVTAFQSLQGKDKALADRVMTDLSWSFSHIFSSNEFTNIIKPIVETGHADLSQAQRLFSGWTSNDLKGVADFISAGSQADWDAIKKNPGILSFLNADEQKVAQSIAAQNGKIQLEDELRIAIRTGDLAKLKEMQKKSPNDLLVARQNYETKYGTVLTDDLRKMRKPEANTAATLFEGPKTAQQSYDDARDRVYASMNQTFDLAGASATQLQGRIDDFAARLTEAGVLKQNMTPEEIKQFNLNVMKALEQYQHNKEAIAEGVVNTVVLAAAVAVAIATFGTGSGVSALMVAAVIGGGAIGQPLMKELIMQGDYDLFGKQGLKDSALGAFTMALALIPPSKLIEISGALTSTARAALSKALGDSPKIVEALQRAAVVLAAVKNVGAPIIDGASTQLSKLTTFTSEAISKAIGESAFTGLVKEAGLQGVGKEAFDTFKGRLAERLTKEVAERGGTALSQSEIKGITSEVLTSVLKEAAETQGTAQLGKVTEFLMAEAVSGSAPRYETALRMISKIPGMDSAKAQELATLLVKEVNATLKSAEGGNLKAMFARLGGDVAETMPEWQKAALSFMTKRPGATHILTQTGFGTVLGGTDGLVRGAIDWDPKLSISQNLAKIAEHAGMGMFMGTVFAGGLTTAISGRSIMRGTFKYPHISTDNFRNLNAIDKALAESGETFTPFKLEKVGNVFESSLDRKITIGQTGAKDVTFTVPGNVNASIENGMLKGKSLIVNGERIADDIPFNLKNGDIIQFGENGHPVLFMRTESGIALTALTPAEKLGIKAVTHNLVDSQPAVIHPGKRVFTIGAEAGADVATDIAGALRVTREGGPFSRSTEAFVENISDKPIKVVRVSDGRTFTLNPAIDGVPRGKNPISGEFRILGETADVRVSLTRSGSIVEQVQKGTEFSGPTRLAAAPVVLKPENFARNTVIRGFTDTGTAIYDAGLAAKRWSTDAGNAIYNRDFKALLPTWAGTRAALAEVPGMALKAPGSALRIAREYGYWGMQKAGEGLKYGWDGSWVGINRGRQSFGRIADAFSERPILGSIFNPNSPESTLFVKPRQLTRLGFTEAPETAAEIAKLRASIARGTTLSKEEIALVKDQIQNVPRIWRNAETGVELEVRGGRIFRQIKEGENFAVAWDGNNVIRMQQNGTWYSRVPAEKGARVGSWLPVDQLAPAILNGEQLQYFAIASGVKKVLKPLGTDEQTTMQALLSRKRGEIAEGVELKPLSKKEERLLASLERRNNFWQTEVSKTTDFAEAQRIAGEKGKILYSRGDANLTEHAFSPSNPLQLAEGGNLWRQMEAAASYRGAEATAPGFTFRITRNGIVRSDGVYLGRSILDTVGLSKLVEAARYSLTRRNRLHILRNGESLEYGRGENFEIMSRVSGARKVTFTHKDGTITADGEFVVLRNGTYKRINGSSELLPGDVVIAGQHLRGRLYKGDAFKVDIEGGVALLKNIASTGRSGIIYAGAGGPNPPKGILLKYLARSIATGSVNLLRSTGPILFKTVLSLGRASTRLPEYIRSRQERVIQRALERGEEGTIKLRSLFRVNGKVEIKADGEIVLTQFKNRERIKIFDPTAEGSLADKLTPKTLGDNATLKLDAGMALQLRQRGEPLQVHSAKSSRPYHEQVSWNKGLGKFRLQETDENGAGVWAPNLFDKITKNNPLTKIEGNKATIFGEDGRALFQVELTKTYENGANVQKLIVRHLGESDTITEVTHLRPKLNKNVATDLVESQKPVKLTPEYEAMIIDGPVSIRVGDKHFRLDEMFTGKRSLENANFIWSQLWGARQYPGEVIRSYVSRLGRSELMDRVMAYPKNWWESGTLRFNRTLDRRTSWTKIKGQDGVFELEGGFKLKLHDDANSKIAVVQHADGSPVSRVYVQKGTTDLTRAQKWQLSRNLKNEFVAVDSATIRKNQPFKLHPDGPTYNWDGKEIVRVQKSSADPVRAPLQVLRDSADGTRAGGVDPIVKNEKVLHYSDIKLAEGKSAIVGRSDVTDIALMHPSVQRNHATITREGNTFRIEPKAISPDNSNTQTYLVLPNGQKVVQSEAFTANIGDVVYFGREVFKVVEIDGAPVLRHVQTTKETAAWLKTARGQKGRDISRGRIEVLDDSVGERSIRRWAAKHEIANENGVAKFDLDGKIRLKNADGVEQVEILATREGFLVKPVGVEPVYVRVKGSNEFTRITGPTFIDAQDAVRFGYPPKDARAGASLTWTNGFTLRPVEVSRYRATEALIRGYNNLSYISPTSFMRSRIYRWARRYEIQSESGNTFKIDSLRNRFRIDGKAEIRATEDGMMLIPKGAEPIYIDRGNGFELVTGPTRIKGTERFRTGTSEIYNPNTGKATNVFTLVGKAGSTELPTGLTRLGMAGKVIALPITAPIKLGSFLSRHGSEAISFARYGATRQNRAINRWADNFAIKASAADGNTGNIKFNHGKVSLEKAAEVKATKDGFTVKASGNEPIYIRRSGAADFEPDAISGAVELKPGDQIRIGKPIVNSEDGSLVNARIYTLEKQVAEAPNKPEMPKAFRFRRANESVVESKAIKTPETAVESSTSAIKALGNELKSLNAGEITNAVKQSIELKLARALERADDSVALFRAFEETAGNDFRLRIVDGKLALSLVKSADETIELAAVELQTSLRKASLNFLRNNSTRLEEIAGLVQKQNIAMIENETSQAFAQRILEQRAILTGIKQNTKEWAESYQRILAEVEQRRLKAGDNFYNQENFQNVLDEFVIHQTLHGKLKGLDEAIGNRLQAQQSAVLNDWLNSAATSLGLKERKIPVPPAEKRVKPWNRPQAEGKQDLDGFLNNPQRFNEFLDEVQSLKTKFEAGEISEEELLHATFNAAEGRIPPFGQLEIAQGLTTEALNKFVANEYQPLIRQRMLRDAAAYRLSATERPQLIQKLIVTENQSREQVSKNIVQILQRIDQDEVILDPPLANLLQNAIKNTLTGEDAVSVTKYLSSLQEKIIAGSSSKLWEQAFKNIRQKAFNFEMFKPGNWQAYSGLLAKLKNESSWIDTSTVLALSKAVSEDASKLSPESTKLLYRSIRQIHESYELSSLSIEAKQALISARKAIEQKLETFESVERQAAAAHFAELAQSLKPKQSDKVIAALSNLKEGVNPVDEQVVQSILKLVDSGRIDSQFAAIQNLLKELEQIPSKLNDLQTRNLLKKAISNLEVAEIRAAEKAAIIQIFETPKPSTWMSTLKDITGDNHWLDRETVQAISEALSKNSKQLSADELKQASLALDKILGGTKIKGFSELSQEAVFFAKQSIDEAIKEIQTIGAQKASIIQTLKSNSSSDWLAIVNNIQGNEKWIDETVIKTLASTISKNFSTLSEPELRSLNTALKKLTASDMYQSINKIDKKALNKVAADVSSAIATLEKAAIAKENTLTVSRQKIVSGIMEKKGRTSEQISTNLVDAAWAINTNPEILDAQLVQTLAKQVKLHLSSSDAENFTILFQTWKKILDAPFAATIDAKIINALEDVVMDKFFHFKALSTLDRSKWFGLIQGRINGNEHWLDNSSIKMLVTAIDKDFASFNYGELKEILASLQNIKNNIKFESYSKSAQDKLKSVQAKVASDLKVRLKADQKALAEELKGLTIFGTTHLTNPVYKLASVLHQPELVDENVALAILSLAKSGNIPKVQWKEVNSIIEKILTHAELPNSPATHKYLTEARSLLKKLIEASDTLPPGVSQHTIISSLTTSGLSKEQISTNILKAVDALNAHYGLQNQEVVQAIVKAAQTNLSSKDAAVFQKTFFGFLDSISNAHKIFGLDSNAMYTFIYKVKDQAKYMNLLEYGYSNKGEWWPLLKNAMDVKDNWLDESMVKALSRAIRKEEQSFSLQELEILEETLLRLSKESKFNAASNDINAALNSVFKATENLTKNERKEISDYLTSLISSKPYANGNVYVKPIERLIDTPNLIDKDVASAILALIESGKIPKSQHQKVLLILQEIEANKGKYFTKEVESIIQQARARMAEISGLPQVVENSAENIKRISTKDLAAKMEDFPSAAQFKKLIGDQHVGDLPAEFAQTGLNHNEIMSVLDKLALALRNLDGVQPTAKKSGFGTNDLKMGPFNIKVGTQTVTVEKIGIGEVAHVYKLTINGKSFAFKIPTDAARLDVHGAYSEVGAFVFLAKHKASDLIDFHAANPSPPHGWMLVEHVSQPIQRQGQPIDKILEKYGLRLGDDWAANRGPGNVVWDLGGIEPLNVKSPFNLKDFKQMLSTPEGRMIAVRRMDAMSNQQEIKEALILALSYPDLTGQVARTAAKKITSPADLAEILQKALQTPGAAGRAAFELDRLAGSKEITKLFYLALSNPESRLEAVKHLDKLPILDRFAAFTAAFKYPEARPLTARALPSIPEGAERNAALALAQKDAGANYVINRLALNPNVKANSTQLTEDLSQYLERYGIKLDTGNSDSLANHVKKDFLSPAEKSAGQKAQVLKTQGEIDTVSGAEAAVAKALKLKTGGSSQTAVTDTRFGTYKSASIVTPSGKTLRTPEGGKVFIGRFHLTADLPNIPTHNKRFAQVVDTKNGFEISPVVNHPLVYILRQNPNGSYSETLLPFGSTHLLAPGERIRIGPKVKGDGNIFDFNVTDRHRRSATAKSRRSISPERMEELENHFIDEATEALRKRRVEQVEQMFQKYNPETVSVKDLEAIINHFSPSDRTIIETLIERSAFNASEGGIFAQMRALHNILAMDYTAQIFTLSADSAGNGLGYLFRKVNKISQLQIKNIDQLTSGNVPLPSKIYLFDDLSSSAITPEVRKLLKNIPEVVVVDLNAFEKGVNFIDFAMGKEAVIHKLTKLLQEVKTHPSNQKGLLPKSIIDSILRGNVDSVAASIGSNVKVKRVPKEIILPGIPSKQSLDVMEPLEYLHTILSSPKVGRDAFATHLAKIPVEDREIAARMIYEGATYYSFHRMVKEMQLLGQEVQQVVAKKGSTWSDVKVVTDFDPGGSTHFMTYLFGKANPYIPAGVLASKLEGSSFFKPSTFNEKLFKPKKPKIVVAMDDSIYSGSQMAGHIGYGEALSAAHADHVVVATLGSFEKGLNAMKDTNTHKQKRLSIIAPTLHQKFFSSNHPFFGSLNSKDKAIAQKLGGYNGFDSTEGSIIWAYMYPDNNIGFFGDDFSGKVLGLSGPAG